MLTLLIKKALHKRGLRLVRVRDRGDSAQTAYPYIKALEVQGRPFNFWIENYTARDWYDTEFWKNESEIRELLGLLAPADRILEIGANHGFFTTIMAARLQTGHFVGVEAVPRNCMVSQANLALNGLSQRARVLNVAISDRPSKVEMYDTTDASICLDRSAVGKGVPSEATVEIDAVTGDSLDREYGPFTFLKVDVEGYEVIALRGCREILARRPKLALELHGARRLAHYATSIDDLCALIPFSEYEGVMYVRPKYDVVPFDVERIKEPGAHANIFLAPKSRGAAVSPQPSASMS